MSDGLCGVLTRESQKFPVLWTALPQRVLDALPGVR